MSVAMRSVCPSKKGAFGLVIASAILEHVIDLRECVSESIGSIREGGMLLINVPYLEDLTPYLHCRYEFSHLRSFDEAFLVGLFKDLNVLQVYYHDFNLIFASIRSPLLNRMLGVLYAGIPKRLRCFLLKTKWTSWMKPFSISIVFQKRDSKVCRAREKQSLFHSK